MAEQAYIVQALRTAGGRRKGRLADMHPADLGALSVDALLGATGIDPAAVEDVVFGCVSQVGEQSNHVARSVVLASRLPASVPAVTIDRQCGSSQQALHFAAQAVMSGTQDMVIAGGVESITRVPMGSPFRMAAAAIASGAFDDEIVRVGDHSHDEGVRLDGTAASMAAVRPIVEGGSLTAANASQMTDGSSAALVVNERALKAHGLVPIARIHALAVTAGDPVVMLEQPIPATRKVLERAGLALSDIDLFEVNEAFASVRWRG